MSYANGRYGLDYSHYSYKAKLLGIHPTNFTHSQDSGLWELKDIKVCKKPSEQEVKGQIDYAGHPTLVGSAISERKHGIAEYISFETDTLNSSNENNNSSSSNNSDEENDGNGKIGNDGAAQDAKLQNKNESVKSAHKKDSLQANYGMQWVHRSDREELVKEMSSKDATELVDEERDSDLVITNFMKNCFDPRIHALPDFICERLLSIFLASNEDTFVIQARKLKFVPKHSTTGEEVETIELKFLPHSIRSFSFAENGWLGPIFSTWAVGSKAGEHAWSSKENVGMFPWKQKRSILYHSNEEDSVANVQSSTRTLRISESNDSETNQSQNKDGDDDDYEMFVHHHHAFIQGEIARHSKNPSPRSFTVGMSALVGGVWKLEENPENYTCGHLAEMRTAQETTVHPFSSSGKRNTFYKRVRMRRNWVQAMLAGESQYMVGITGSVPNKDPHVRVIKELWLYDVEKIPRAIQISAEDEDFVPWTAEEILEKIFNAFQLIHETVNTAAFEDSFNFIQFSDFDQLIYDPDGDLLKVYMNTKKQVVIRGLPSPAFTVDTIEDKAKFDTELFLTIIKCVGYPDGAEHPSIERVGRDLELTFDSQSLAANFINFVKIYWTRKKNIPPGFERLWIEQKPVNLPKDHPLAGRVLDKIRPSPNTNRFHNRHNSNNNINNDFYHGGNRNNSSPVGSPSYRPPGPPGGRQRSISMSDQDDNWRR